MEFLSAYNFRLSYRRGQENANADFLSRLPLPPNDEDVSGASALTDPDDLGVYIIRACGLTKPLAPSLAWAWVGWPPRRIFRLWMGWLLHRISRSWVGYP